MTDDETSDKPSRRSFLKLSAAAAAGAATPAAGAALPAERGELPTLLPVPPAPGFDHLVVLMCENRSFDNFLGHLYPPGTIPDGESFNGVANGAYSNTSPSGPIAAHIYVGGTDHIMRSPTPD